MTKMKIMTEHIVNIKISKIQWQKYEQIQKLKAKKKPEITTNSMKANASI